ncbi:MAG: DUF4167 domain-containing protein [Albidovulum sp.]|nr:DUF4167 domain-containing protein [Albidovulum sp.]MDE0531266.1 DUF4167 domain-containing protein [Albidovulum sp.]
MQDKNYQRMRAINKSRVRNKNSRRAVGNVLNRVFESSGPEGKIRGTPQQIIEKYQALSRDASLSGDRVAAENFAQHSEHYARLLSEAQLELEARREMKEAQAAAHRRTDSPTRNGGQPAEKPESSDNPIAAGDTRDSGLVDTPEGISPKRARAASHPGAVAVSEKSVGKASAVE